MSYEIDGVVYVVSLRQDRVYVRADLAGEDARKTLLHEMCHVATGCTGHSQEFIRELRRLGTLGERWANHEADVFSQPQAPLTRDDLLERMEEMAASPKPPAWAAARQHLAEEAGLSLLQFDRAHPELQRHWHQLLGCHQPSG